VVVTHIIQPALESLTIHYNLHPINIIIISGIIQIFVLAGILYNERKKTSTANRILATLILISALHFSWYMIMDTNLDQVIGPNVLRIPFSYLLAIGPLFYWYTAKLTTSNFQIRQRELIHLLPVLVEVVLEVSLGFQSAINHQQIYEAPFYLFFKTTELLCAGISILWYIKKSLLLIKDYELSLADYYSDHSHMTLSWLTRLMKYIRILWIFWVMFECGFILFWHFQLHYAYVYLALYLLMTIMTYSTYWIGLSGFQALGALSEKRFKPENTGIATSFYAKMSTEEIDGVVQRLEAIMKNEKVFLYENLSLQTLAERLKENPNRISYVLNSTLQKSFYDYVNAYRIEEVKTKMRHPKYTHLKLIEIAYECGFNSKATFNRSFKKMVGMSPSDYRDVNLNQ
jgi:AraC-like DNA-binding protein